LRLRRNRDCAQPFDLFTRRSCELLALSCVRQAMEDHCAKPRRGRRPTNNVRGERTIMARTAEEKLARDNRLRLQRADGELAMKEAAQAGIAVRLNMTRLRELRLKKEAETASDVQAPSSQKPLKRARRR